MRIGVTVAGLAARIAAARVERMRAEAVRAALAEVAWRASRRATDPQASPPQKPVASTTEQQRS